MGDCSEIRKRSRRESGEYLAEALGKSEMSLEITDSFSAEKVCEGYECIVVNNGEEGMYDYFLVSPDSRPSYARITHLLALHEFEYITYSRKNSNAWEIFDIMAWTALDVRVKL